MTSPKSCVAFLAARCRCRRIPQCVPFPNLFPNNGFRIGIIFLTPSPKRRFYNWSTKLNLCRMRSFTTRSPSQNLWRKRRFTTRSPPRNLSGRHRFLRGPHPRTAVCSVAFNTASYVLNLTTNVWFTYRFIRLHPHTKTRLRISVHHFKPLPQLYIPALVHTQDPLHKARGRKKVSFLKPITKPVVAPPVPISDPCAEAVFHIWFVIYEPKTSPYIP